MEIPRMCLAIGGKFPGDYEDGRFSEPPAGLEANLGRMPVCSTPVGSIGQSTAINFYVASENGLMGSSVLEAAQILAVTEHVKELMAAWRSLVPYGTEPSAEKLETWFKTGAEDSTGPADGANRSSRYLKWFCGRIEVSLGEKFAVGCKLSLADVTLYNTFAEVLKKEEQPADFAQWKAEPFGSLAFTQELLASYPKISASISAVAANPGVQRWLSTRGVQYF